MLTTLILIIVYYVTITILTRKSLIRIKEKPEYKSSSPTEKDDSEFSEASALKQSIQEVFALAATRKWIKEEVLSGLASRLQVYSHLQDTPYQYAIEDFIIKEANDQLKVSLVREEVSPLW